jgi:hypothetical protein
LATPRLANWLGLPAGEPVLLSTGQLTSILVLAAVALAMFYRRRTQTPAA